MYVTSKPLIGIGLASTLMASAAFVGPAAAVASPGASVAAGTPTASLSVGARGAPKVKILVRGKGFRKILRKARTVRLKAGRTYRIKALPVTHRGVRYEPRQHAYKVRVKRTRVAFVAFDYVPVPSTKSLLKLGDTPPAGPLGRVYQLVNEARSQAQICGTRMMPAVPPVVYDNKLQKAAQAHAQDMVTNNYFDHLSLDGRTFVDRIEAAGYQGQPGGENIAMGSMTPDETVAAWMDSAGHCENIMTRSFMALGLGLATQTTPSGSSVGYWVQEFGYGQ